MLTIKCPNDKAISNQTIVEGMMDHIRRDIGLWEYHHEDPPGKIFMSRPLYELIRAYNTNLIYNYADPRSVKIFGIPVEPYYPGEKDALEYHLADGGKKFDWKGA